MRTKVPSVVVIQERHVRHGEKFKILKVNSRSKREYVSKFLSTRKFTFRCKSRQVVIGRRTKELRYKGSPMAISRLLLLDGLGELFPQFGQMKKSEQADKREASRSSSPICINPPLSFFNLSDTRAVTSKGPSAKTNAGPVMKLDSGDICSQVDVTCSPQSLCDFRLLFWSDTAESEDESDGDEAESVSVEVDDTLFSSDKNNDKKQQNALNNSIKKIEKDVNQIANNIQSAFEAAAQKVSVTFPQQNAITNPSQPPNNGEHPIECNNNIPRNPPNYENSQRSHRNNNQPNPTNCQYLQSSGSVPFFRVPGGCVMVVQATNETTPVLYATFITGDGYRQQYQQVQLPIYGMQQNVSIHIGPFRLRRAEVARIFNFFSNHCLNPGRF